MLRHLIHTSTEIISRVYEDTTDADEMVDHAEKDDL